MIAASLLYLDLRVAERLRKKRLAPEDADRAAGKARALSDPTRLMLAAALLEANELCVCDLAWIAERSQTLVFHHVRALRSPRNRPFAAGGQDGHVLAHRRGARLARVRPAGDASTAQEARACLSRATPLVQLREARPLTLPVPCGGSGAGGARAARAEGAAARLGRDRLARGRVRDRGWGWLAAGSIALIGFGADSLIEALAGVSFSGFLPAHALARACRAACATADCGQLSLLAAIPGRGDANLVGGDHPAASWVGIGLAAFTAPTMPLLA